jgi:hypothetical protein
MENKIKRFIELSKEFTIESKEIYGKNDSSIYTAGWTSCATGQEQHFIKPTRLEVFTEEQNKKIAKAERYEEYLTLQTDLSNYYNALIKLK